MADDRDSQGRLIVRNASGYKTGVRTGAEKVEAESYADAQKRRDEANEDPLQKELRLKREAKQNAETPPPSTASASPTPATTPPPKQGLGGLAAAIAKNRAIASQK